MPSYEEGEKPSATPAEGEHPKNWRPGSEDGIIGPVKESAGKDAVGSVFNSRGEAMSQSKFDSLSAAERTEFLSSND